MNEVRELNIMNSFDKICIVAYNYSKEACKRKSVKRSFK